NKLRGFHRSCKVELIGFEVQPVRRINTLRLMSVAALDSSGGKIALRSRPCYGCCGLRVCDLACFYGVTLSGVNSHLAGEFVDLDMLTASAAQILDSGIVSRVADRNFVKRSGRSGAGSDAITKRRENWR